MTGGRLGGPPGTLAELRRARRVFVRTAHPDRGGDPARFRTGLAEFDRLIYHLGGSAGARPEPPVRVVVVRRPRGLAGWLRHLARHRPGRRSRPARVH